MGWAQLFGEVVLQGFGLKNDLPNKIGRIDHARAERVLLHVERAEQVQVDGDVLGRAVEVRTWVEPLALVVRAPIPGSARGRPHTLHRCSTRRTTVQAWQRPGPV